MLYRKTVCEGLCLFWLWIGTWAHTFSLTNGKHVYVFCKVLIFHGRHWIVFPFKNRGFVQWDNDFSFMCNLDFFGICSFLSFSKYSQGSHKLGAGCLQGCFLELPLSLLCQLCATLSGCYDCFLLRGKFLFHQYGCTVFTHCECCVAVSVILLGPVSDE